jgi:hypothetical protein
MAFTHTKKLILGQLLRPGSGSDRIRNTAPEAVEPGVFRAYFPVHGSPINYVLFRPAHHSTLIEKWKLYLSHYRLMWRKKVNTNLNFEQSVIFLYIYILVFLLIEHYNTLQYVELGLAMLIAMLSSRTQAPHKSAEGEMRGQAFLVIRLQV